MHPLKRTKIIATIGPASNKLEILTAMLDEGVDLVRINFSHGYPKKHLEAIKLVRTASQMCRREIGIIADLQGPKIRIAKFKQGSVDLIQGQRFILDCNDNSLGDDTRVGVDYPELAKEVKAEDNLLLDDGLIELEVIKVEKSLIETCVVSGGKLSNNKGINLKGGGLSASALTAKDLNDIKVAVNAGVDYIALSFARHKADVISARDAIKKHSGDCAIITKIERAEALNHIDDIISASDSVMVARGDLGVEIGLAEVPFVQKDIINRARALDKTVITATQMMESMIHSPQATRAEVSDVANAVLDGTDAVMLSAETAVGDYPVRVIKTVKEVCLSAEGRARSKRSKHRMECEFTRIDESIAMAAMYTANHFPIKAIITLTETGATPLWMSRIRSSIPIIGLSRHQKSLRKMTLFRGVYPLRFDLTLYTSLEIEAKVVDFLKSLALVRDNDKVILTKGESLGDEGGTNSLKIIVV